MSGIWVAISILLFVLGPVLFPWVGEGTVGVAAVGALPLGFQVKLGLVRGKFLPAGLHAAEASYVSSSSTSALTAAIVRAVWSTKMPLANTPAILNLRKNIRTFGCWILSLRVLKAMGLFIYFLLLLLSWALLGMVVNMVGFGSPLPPLRMMTGPVQHFRSAILEAWRF